MLRNRLLALLFAAGFAVGINPHLARAQSSCPIASEAPIDISATTYTVGPNDACSFLNFISGIATTVTLPAPNTALIPSGFKIFIKADENQTVTLSAANGIAIDNRMSSVAVTQGTGGYLWVGSNKWYWQGLGIKHP